MGDGEEAAIFKSAAKDTGEALDSAGGKLGTFIDDTGGKAKTALDRLTQAEDRNTTLSDNTDPAAPALPEGTPTPAHPADPPPSAIGPPDPDHLGDPVGDDPAEGRETPDGGWEGPDDLRLTPDENAAANQFLAQARDAEPDITSIVSGARDTAPGAELEGYPKYVLKSANSFKRKLGTALRRSETSAAGERDVQAALRQVKDSVRYTVKLPNDGTSYADGVQSAVRHLKRSGAAPVDWKNTWEEPGYQGINSFWRDPRTGRLFEVQLHTQESFTAKMVTHDLFEEQRLQGTPPERKLELQAQQDQIFGSIPRPPGAAGIPPPASLRPAAQ